MSSASANYARNQLRHIAANPPRWSDDELRDASLVAWGSFNTSADPQMVGTAAIVISLIAEVKKLKEERDA